jgi:hypothetical protein
VIASRSRLKGTELDFYPLSSLAKAGLPDPSGLPMTVKVLLEGLLRLSDAGTTREENVKSLAVWPKAPPPDAELPFLPARVLMQDFTGVPAVVDLAAMRSAMQRAGKNAGKVDPLVPVDLIIDHSVQVDSFGFRDSYTRNIQREIERNHERYALLRWAQQAFHNFSLVPPGMGICHQVNLEYVAKVVQVRGLPADPDRRRRPLQRRAAGRIDGDRPRTHAHGDAAQARRGREVRRVLRRWPFQPVGPRSRHAEQHVPRVRGDLCALPCRRPDPSLPQRDRPEPRTDRARGAVHQRAGPLPHRRRRHT